MNYHIADFIVRIKNASAARRKEVVMPYSNSIRDIAKVLVKEGFLAGTKEEEVDGQKVVRVTLRYVKRKPVVTSVEVISKPSLRTYVQKKVVAGRHLRDAKVAIMTTSKGIMTGKEALKQGVGGELLFKVW
jgi:small subunit ribosomal protein S8